jgi:hypothetical protein
MSTQVSEQASAKTPTVTPATMFGEFGNGRYSTIARELYRDSQRVLNLSDEQADKLSRSYMADIGRANMEAKSVKVGKLNKDGYVNLSESAKAKYVKLTDSMRIAKIVVTLDEARKLGVDKFDKITLDKTLVGWLDGKLD